MSIACNIILDKFPDNPSFQNNEIVPINVYIQEPQPLDAIVPYESNVSVSNKSNVSDNIFNSESLNEYI